MKKILLFIILMSTIASAVTFNVDSTTDAGDADTGNGMCDDGTGSCTLRAAVEQVNALALSHIINVPAGTYTLTLGELTVTQDVTINGVGALTTIIDGNANDRVFSNAFGVVFTINDVTIRNGLAFDGGGIKNSGGTQSF